MWIFVEGFHLYGYTKSITFGMTNWIRHYVFLANGAPLVIVGITVLCAGLSDGIMEVYSGDET